MKHENRSRGSRALEHLVAGSRAAPRENRKPSARLFLKNYLWRAATGRWTAPRHQSSAAGSGSPGYAARREGRLRAKQPTAPARAWRGHEAGGARRLCAVHTAWPRARASAIARVLVYACAIAGGEAAHRPRAPPPRRPPPRRRRRRRRRRPRWAPRTTPTGGKGSRRQPSRPSRPLRVQSCPPAAREHRIQLERSTCAAHAAATCWTHTAVRAACAGYLCVHVVQARCSARSMWLQAAL